MSSTQKVVKCIAMFLAGCLTISIIAAIVNVGVGVLGAFVPQKSEESNKVLDLSKSDKVQNEHNKAHNTESESSEFANVENLNIASSVYKMEIRSDKTVDKVRIVKKNIPSSYNIYYDKDSKTLFGEDDNWVSGLFSKKRAYEKGSITIYIPDVLELKKLYVDMGVGSVKLSGLQTHILDIKCGVGSFSCKSVIANTAEIDGGVGTVNCDDVSFGGLELSGGVGDIDVRGQLKGKIDVSAGMGNLKLKIDESKDSFNITVDTGLGPVYIDGKKTEDMEKINNNQSNVLDVEGGIGAVHIDFN